MPNAQEAQLAVENLCRLRTALYLASQVGAELVGSQVLLPALSRGAAAEDGVTDSLGPSPAAGRHPDHRIAIATSEETWVATLGDELLASLCLERIRDWRVIHQQAGWRL